ncbi:hypothetical protein EGW08_014527 [Elysia chlorotica]|uniref:Uncharacterized protein n=1 Tax=Elysia chlorotica TaxID=188477 RepID=A0A3S1B7C7_ELYCH|nr:hypothetical protein EGW08_014527 [Elysia chlorotica]
MVVFVFTCTRKNLHLTILYMYFVHLFICKSFMFSGPEIDILVFKLKSMPVVLNYIIYSRIWNEDILRQIFMAVFFSVKFFLANNNNNNNNTWLLYIATPKTMPGSVRFTKCLK